MRFEVPQFIEVEDKIVGPLTWKQFVYLAGGAGVVVVTYILLPFFIFVLIGVPFGALAGFLAFRQVNNRPFSIFLESFVTYFSRSRLYLWRKTEEQTITTKGTSASGYDDPIAHVGQHKVSALAQKLELVHR